MIKSVNVGTTPQVTIKNEKSRNVKSHTQESLLNGQVVNRYEMDATSGKKWGVGLASVFCTGLGQAINGQWGKGLGFFLGGLALSAANYKALRSNKLGLALGVALSAIGLKVATVVDAVKNAKSTVTTISDKATVAAE